MPAPAKVEQYNQLKKILGERGDFVVSTYSGLTVGQFGELRAQVRAKGARMRVVKNNIFRLLLKETAAYAPIADDMAKVLKGPVAISFASADLPAVSKAILEFAKKNDKVEVRGGCLDGQFLGKTEVEAVANLPSREELLSIIGRGLNAPATKIATGMKQIITSVARGINEVARKNAGQ